MVSSSSLPLPPFVVSSGGNSTGTSTSNSRARSTISSIFPFQNIHVFSKEKCYQKFVLLHFQFHLANLVFSVSSCRSPRQKERLDSDFGFWIDIDVPNLIFFFFSTPIDARGIDFPVSAQSAAV